MTNHAKNSTNALLALGGILVIVAAALSWHGMRNRASDLPDLVLADLANGQTMIDVRDLTVGPALINFWASWCVACREDHPLLMEMHSDNEAPVYGVNYRDDRNDALRWLAYYGNPYRRSVVDDDGHLGDRLGVDALPVTYVVDAAGQIHYEHLGPLDRASIDEVIMPLLDNLQERTMTQ